MVPSAKWEALVKKVASYKMDNLYSVAFLIWTPIFERYSMWFDMAWRMDAKSTCVKKWLDWVLKIWWPSRLNRQHNWGKLCDNLMSPRMFTFSQRTLREGEKSLATLLSHLISLISIKTSTVTQTCISSLQVPCLRITPNFLRKKALPIVGILTSHSLSLLSLHILIDPWQVGSTRRFEWRMERFWCYSPPAPSSSQWKQALKKKGQVYNWSATKKRI